jgi:hypothetical protein
MLDILISIVFGGMLFLNLIDSGNIAYENRQEGQSMMIVQQDLTVMVQMLEGEFRNAGCGVATTSPTVLRGETSYISFAGDQDGNGSPPDTMTYYLGNTSEMSGTPNENDRPLYRRMNGGAPMLVGALTILQFRYFNMNGEEMPVPVPVDRLAEVRTIEVSAETQSPGGVQTQGGKTIFPASMWQQTRLSSRNSNR